MYLQNLSLRAFRNYLEQEVVFHSQKTIIVGNNAQGKSNLLEAIELLATLKSHRALRDRELVLDSEVVGQIEATVKRVYGTADLTIKLRKQGKRTFAVNHESLRRSLDFLGYLNAVQFSSLDLDLVRGGPESRRDWIDGLLVQLEPVYVHILQQYNQVLRQRNALLKAIRKQEQDRQLGLATTAIDKQQLALWDAQLAASGSRVTRRRARVLTRLAPIAQSWHDRISGKTEMLQIEYAPNVEWTEDKPEKVQLFFPDDIDFTIDGTPARYSVFP